MHQNQIMSSESKSDKNVWLFDIKNDPYEEYDVSEVLPDIVEFMLDRLSAYNKTAVPPRFPAMDPNCDPALRGGVWGPWM